MKQRFLDEPEQIDMEMGGNEGQGNANNGSGNGGNGEEELSQYYRPALPDSSYLVFSTDTANGRTNFLLFPLCVFVIGEKQIVDEISK